MLPRGKPDFKHPQRIKLPPRQGWVQTGLLIFLSGNQLVSIADEVLERCLGEPLDGRKVCLKIHWKPRRIALVLWPWFKELTDPSEPDTFHLWRRSHRMTKHSMYFKAPHLRELLGIDNTKPAVGYPLHALAGRIHVNIRTPITPVYKNGKGRMQQ